MIIELIVTHSMLYTGIYTKYKPYLNKDKNLLKKLMKVPISNGIIFKICNLFSQGIESHRPSEVQSAIIRRHFFEMTQSFLIPLV